MFFEKSQCALARKLVRGGMIAFGAAGIVEAVRRAFVDVDGNCGLCGADLRNAGYWK